MKKIVILIVAIAIIIGAVFGVRAIVKSSKSTDRENNVSHKVELIEKEYMVGENVIFRCLVTANVQFTSLTYSINNEQEKELSTTIGESKNFSDAMAIGDGKYFIDTGAEIIDTNSRTAGYYTLIIHAYDADGTSYEITTTPIVFRLKVTSVA